MNHVRRSYGRHPDTANAMIVATSRASSKGWRAWEVCMACGRWSVSIIGLFCGSLAAAEALPRLHALTDEWTVSGLSSGGYMASQIAVAHSRQVRGVGVFAGGPFYCVGIDPGRAEGECMKGTPDPEAARREAEKLAALKLIDPVDNLKKTRSWVLAGAVDEVVAEP